MSQSIFKRQSSWKRGAICLSICPVRQLFIGFTWICVDAHIIRPSAFSFILFCCLFIILILTLSVSYHLQRRMVGWQWIIGKKGLQRGARVLVVSSIPARTTWEYWDRARILVPSPKFKTFTPTPNKNKTKLPLNPKLITDNFITIWSSVKHVNKCTYNLSHFSVTAALLCGIAR